MRTFVRLLLPVLAAGALSAQFPGLTLPPSGGNQKASVTQFAGPVQVTIEYSSPSVHGPLPGGGMADRRGKIWGQLVPYGLNDQGFGNRKPAPWRGGANENTVFTVSHPVLIEGRELAAGRYGLFFITGADEWTVIFSRNYTSWGSFFYEESEDALRVPVKPAKHEYREHLTYEFPVRKADETRAELQWEDLAVGWKMQVPNANQIYFTQLRKELRNATGFSWQAWDAAAQFALQANENIEEALRWNEYSRVGAFIGQVNFTTLTTQSQLLDKLGRGTEAAAALRAAIEHPTAGKMQIHMIGRQLLTSRKTKEAAEVFEYNYKRFGGEWPTHVGMTRALSASGDYAKALEHAKQALAQAPDEINRKSLESMVRALSSGKPVDN